MTGWCRKAPDAQKSAGNRRRAGGSVARAASALTERSNGGKILSLPNEGRMRRKLLIVGLLAIAGGVVAFGAWFGLRDQPRSSPPPVAAAPSAMPPLSSDGSINTPIKDTLPEINPQSRVMEQDLKAIGARLGQALAGKVLYNPPPSMLIDETERIEVRIAPGDYVGDIRAGLVGRGVPMVETIEISAVMRVRLHGAAFSVDPPSGEAQAILPGRLAQWNFDVTPTRAGKQTLELEVSYLVNADGKSYPSTLPPFRREIEINVGTWHSIAAALKENRELAVSTAIGVTLGLTGFFLKLWYMERRARKLRAVEAAAVVRRPRRKRRR